MLPRLQEGFVLDLHGVEVGRELLYQLIFGKFEIGLAALLVGEQTLHNLDADGPAVQHESMNEWTAKVTFPCNTPSILTIFVPFR